MIVQMRHLPFPLDRERYSIIINSSGRYGSSGYYYIVASPPAARGQSNRERMSSFAPENLVSRDRFGSRYFDLDRFSVA